MATALCRALGCLRLRSYKKARKCVAEERERCGESGDLFDVLSSGFHYMCIEQGKAFKANIECIDREAHQVKAGELLGGLRSGEFAPAFGERPVPLDPGQSHLGVDPKTGNELVNMVYANETFEEGNEADLFNATSLSEDDINRVLAEKYLRSKAPQRVSGKLF
ncbi:unnamed protein product [Heligmosomoides polygyrus]|uniref:CPG4 domain-containing protein n=1 Tax=Heligmosomoides polygyrus TaxID=6339 RepID=A0A3P8BSM9_HELPZ|nr:unnamed protein product [Heligmosomoides polygyrus]